MNWQRVVEIAIVVLIVAALLFVLSACTVIRGKCTLTIETKRTYACVGPTDELKRLEYILGGGAP